ncbi:uncharacterized protein LOC129592484 [Paramacrobiotus metropolitanus]|uniref:uncharacterized protein LOC129592484 n=1 Tax=Paramacrobiotus metropolitanus TaxID=2943436 RepID=UPI00244622F9|nr:uncharacterized protein LOC129592484 [Paramacrobiotus metropolitanus]
MLSFPVLVSWIVLISVSVTLLCQPPTDYSPASTDAPLTTTPAQYPWSCAADTHPSLIACGNLSTLLKRMQRQIQFQFCGRKYVNIFDIYAHASIMLISAKSTFFRVCSGAFYHAIEDATSCTAAHW